MIEQTDSPLHGLRFNNRFVRALPADPQGGNFVRQVRNACYSRVQPRRAPAPRLIAHAREVAELIGLSAQACEQPEFAEVFAGNHTLPGMDPHATCYGGHQFGNWAGQLGDGRAINLGEAVNERGEHWTLQLKGAGLTPYSRTADGLAVLRSSLREFLCSEAMHHLGVPTTRALSLVTTGDEVVRDILYDGHPAPEPGAVVCRVAPSFTRFGHFQMLAARGEADLLRRFTDFTITTDFPEIRQPGPGASAGAANGIDPSADTVGGIQSKAVGDADRGGTPPLRQGASSIPADGPLTGEHYIRWFQEVCQRTCETIVHWMRVGFVHGVMNTDNMSILGLTIDYGPYGWLDNYDPDWTPNTTDAGTRRYRFGQQPAVAQWNLLQLANAILPLIGEAQPLEEALRDFADDYQARHRAMMARKLGLAAFDAATHTALCAELEEVLRLVETDMTLFFRCLADIDLDDSGEAALAVLNPSWYDPSAVVGDKRERIKTWLDHYMGRARHDNTPPGKRRASMHRVNPKYVLRNYLAQLAIDDAEQGDVALVNRLLEVLRHPYDEQPDCEHLAAKRPDWARNRPGCSMLSCSS